MSPGFFIVSTLALFLAASTGWAETEIRARYQGEGLCQFALEGYVLAPKVEKTINQVTQRLFDQHEAMFKFEPRPDFRLRMRIFGRFEDYARFMTNGGLTPSWLIQAGISNLGGFYTGATKELVTWRQHVQSSFGNVLLHEASHAIMDAHYRGTPQWLLEGCAEYFAYPPDMQDAADKRKLQIRWGLMNLWLRDGNLASLASFVNLKQADWEFDIDRAYVISWSIFQFLVSSEPNRAVMRKLLLARRGPRGAELDPAGRLEAEYPGGLKKLESDWHRWIVQTGRRLFPEESLDALREADRAREKRPPPPPSK